MKIALSNGSFVEVVDETLQRLLDEVYDESLPADQRRLANEKLIARHDQIKADMLADLGGDPKAVELISGKTYVAKGNRHGNIDTKNSGEFVTGQADVPALPQYESAGSWHPGVWAGKTIEGVANFVQNNPLLATAATGTGVIALDRLAGSSIDGIKPTLDAQSDPNAPNTGKSRSLRMPKGGSVVNPDNFIETKQAGLQNLTTANDGKVLEAMPTTAPTLPELGYKKVGKKQTANYAKAMENADEATRKTQNLGKYYDVTNPIYEQNELGSKTTMRKPIDGNALIAQQQKSLPSPSYLVNRFRELGKMDMEGIKEVMPRGMKRPARVTEDPKVETKIPKTGIKAAGVLAAPSLLATAYGTHKYYQNQRRNQNLYNRLQTVLEQNKVDTASGQPLYSDQDVQEALQLIQMLQDSGAIK